MITFLKKLFSSTSTPPDLKKFLIVGLGNIGVEYHDTRHNIGFLALDHYAQDKDLTFEEIRYGKVLKTRLKGKTLFFLKPSTFMNNSGKAVRYWALKENIAVQNILIITDDLNLPFGTLRLKSKGSDGGHNGLKDIQAQLNTTHYPRLRFGIHSDEKGFNTVDFVLGKWSSEEEKTLPERAEKMRQIIESFCNQGIGPTMNQFNGT